MTVFRIRTDPEFFADPDPDFKNPNPDPFVFAFIIFNQCCGSGSVLDPGASWIRIRIRKTDPHMQI